MPRYIDANALQKRLSNCEFETNCVSEDNKREILKILRIFIPQIIANEPTVDVEPINTTRETPMSIMFETEEYDAHGEHYQITRPYCPNCNHIFYAAFGDKQDCINDYRVTRKVVPNYCPKCGQALDWSEIAGASLIG